MKKIIILSVFMSLSVHSAGEEGTGNQPLNNTTQQENTNHMQSCMLQLDQYDADSIQEHYALCLSLSQEEQNN